MLYAVLDLTFFEASYVREYKNNKMFIPFFYKRKYYEKNIIMLFLCELDSTDYQRKLREAYTWDV